MSKVAWIILLIIIWTFICSWWYICGVKDLCVQDDNILLEERIDLDGSESVDFVQFENSDVKNEFDELLADEQENSIAQDIKSYSSSAIVCKAYLSNELVLGGAQNDLITAQKAAVFFNTYENESLEVDDEFTQVDALAVMRFQKKYAVSMTMPDTTLRASGNVDAQTRDQINVIYCLHVNDRM